MQLEVFSDAICPWCFIGKRRLDNVLVGPRADDIDLTWRAYQLHPQIPIAGMDRDEFMKVRFGGSDKVGDAYKRIEAEGASEGIEFNFRGIRRMPNTRQAHRLAIWAKEVGVQSALIEVLFQFHFCAGSDVGDEDTLVEAARQAGMETAATRDFLRSDARLDELLADLQFALAAEISGVPCFVIERSFAIPGAQPSEVLARYLDKAKANIAARAASQSV